MSETTGFVLLGIAVTHILIWIVLFVYDRGRHRTLQPALFVWAFLLPVFGPIAGWLLATANTISRTDTEWFSRSHEPDRNLVLVTADVQEIVPLEEALVMDNTERRRRLISKAIRLDPMAFLDVLLIARLNQDSETSHYATSTIMEIQRQFQLDLQRRQREIAQHPENLDQRRSLIFFLIQYCSSGLLEGQFLHRQLYALLQELNEVLTHHPDDRDLLAQKVRTALDLDEVGQARAAAQELMTRHPLHETAWLSNLRVCVETQDRSALAALAEQLRHTAVDWSSSGWEQASYWLETAS